MESLVFDHPITEITTYIIIVSILININLNYPSVFVTVKSITLLCF